MAWAKGWIAGKPLITLVVVFLIGVGAGNTSPEDADAEPTKDAVAETEAPEVEPEEEEKDDYVPPPTPDPDARYSQTCDYLLSSDIYGDNHLIGSSKVNNTGNVGVVAEVTFKWFQAGGAAIVEKDTLRIPYNGHKTAKANIPADMDVISRLQALPYDQQCSVRAKLVDTFGNPH